MGGLVVLESSGREIGHWKFFPFHGVIFKSSTLEDKFGSFKLRLKVWKRINLAEKMCSK